MALSKLEIGSNLKYSLMFGHTFRACALKVGRYQQSAVAKKNLLRVNILLIHYALKNKKGKNGIFGAIFLFASTSSICYQ